MGGVQPRIVRIDATARKIAGSLCAIYPPHIQGVARPTTSRTCGEFTPPQYADNQRLTEYGSIELNRLQSEERRWKLPKPFCGGEYEMKVCDYRDIEILPDSVIYADIPYKGTAEYKDESFDHNTFYDWCEAQTAPIFISEYWMPEDRFKPIAEWDRVSTFSSTNNNLHKVEKLFVPIKNYDKYKRPEQLTLF